MIITIKVHTCADGDAAIHHTPPRDLVTAYGYLPSGQIFIQGAAVPRADYKRAIRAVVEWIFEHRPEWSYEIDDSRIGHVEVTP